MLIDRESGIYKRKLEIIVKEVGRVIQASTDQVDRVSTIELVSAQTDTPTHKVVSFVTMLPNFTTSALAQAKAQWEYTKYIDIDGVAKLLKSRIQPKDLVYLGKRQPCCFRTSEDCEADGTGETRCAWQDAAYDHRRAKRNASSTGGHFRAIREMAKREKAIDKKKKAHASTNAQLERIRQTRDPGEVCMRWTIGQCGRVTDARGHGCTRKHGPEEATALIHCAQWAQGSTYEAGFMCHFFRRGLQRPYINDHDPDRPPTPPSKGPERDEAAAAGSGSGLP